MADKKYLDIQTWGEKAAKKELKDAGYNGEPISIIANRRGNVPSYPAAIIAQAMMQQAGPASAAYAYPYYTVRGPRDYFMKNPPSIGN